MPPSLHIPPHTHILLARSPAPYSPFRRRAHSPTAFSGPMARPPPSPPRPPPSHIHAGWMVSATRTPTSSAPSQDYLFPLYMRVPEGRVCSRRLVIVSVRTIKRSSSLGVVECAPASPYTYSTHRFPDDRTPIEALLATLLSHTIPFPCVH